MIPKFDTKYIRNGTDIHIMQSSQHIAIYETVHSICSSKLTLAEREFEICAMIGKMSICNA